MSFSIRRFPVQCGIILVMMICTVGCATATHIMIGEKRAPVSPGKVKLYLKPPLKYEVIAIVNVESSDITDRGEKDLAVAELKRHAGSLGANGVLLQTAGTESSGYVGGGNIAPSGSASFVAA